MGRAAEPRARLVVVLLALACAVAGCSSGPDAVVTLGAERLDVAVADEPAERAQGLQGREMLEDGEGMLFVFDEPGVYAFVMKDVRFPIDVVFIAEDLTVSAIEPLDPGDTHRVTAPVPGRYVLELPRGWVERGGVGIGSRFDPGEVAAR